MVPVNHNPRHNQTDAALSHVASQSELAGVDPTNCSSEHAYDAVPIEDLWHEYQKSRSQDLRNYLMEKFLPLVRYNAERIYSRLPDEIDIEDLMSAGLFGLMDAIDAYDLERKVKFETYCAPRIRGAILDELRSMEWVPLLVRRCKSKVDHARQKIEMETGEQASDEQVAQLLGIASDEFEKYKRDSTAVNTISLTRKCFGSDGTGELREIDVIRDETQRNPLKLLQSRDLREMMTKGLSRAERAIVILYYYEAMTMKEIGATLALSESRVSQMHSSILARLKAQMQHQMKGIEEIELNDADRRALAVMADIDETITAIAERTGEISLLVTHMTDRFRVMAKKWGRP